MPHAIVLLGRNKKIRTNRKNNKSRSRKSWAMCICINDPELISKAAKRVGSQSIAAIMDVKK